MKKIGICLFLCMSTPTYAQKMATIKAISKKYFKCETPKYNTYGMNDNRIMNVIGMNDKVIAVRCTCEKQSENILYFDRITFDYLKDFTPSDTIIAITSFASLPDKDDNPLYNAGLASYYVVNSRSYSSPWSTNETFKVGYGMQQRHHDAGISNYGNWGPDSHEDLNFRGIYVAKYDENNTLVWSTIFARNGVEYSVNACTFEFGQPILLMRNGSLYLFYFDHNSNYSNTDVSYFRELNNSAGLDIICAKIDPANGSFQKSKISHTGITSNYYLLYQTIDLGNGSYAIPGYVDGEEYWTLHKLTIE